ncbi:MAG TPA: GNAT family N-acetyltransferase [Xanthomonadaceae bacterium]|nr:GNAT family N-acetyltransferase [Xanthomonadaceae bacterium]
MDDEIVLVERFPDAEAYCALRAAAGMSPKTLDAARRGLPNTLDGVHLRRGALLQAQADRAEIIGMGRIIGDNGCFFVVVDIAVLPEYQGRGLGKRIMAALDAWLSANVPASAYVSLAADGDAKYLYEKFGFLETTPHTVNMEYIAPRTS